MIGLRLSEADTARVDRWAAQHDFSRSEAIRKLLELGLTQTSPRAKKI